MLDFDYVCERKRPSVAAMVYPFRWEIAVRWIFRSLTFGPVLNQHLLQSHSLFFSYLLSYRGLIQNFSFLLFQWKSPTEVLLRTQRNYDSRLVGMIQYYFSCDGILWFYFTLEITGVIFLVGALKSRWSGRFSKSKLEYWVLFYCCLVISGCRAPDFRGVRGSGTTCFLLSSQPAGVQHRKIFLISNFPRLFVIPVYKEMSEAMNKHPDADVMVNFASLRSAYDATLEALQFPQVSV